MGGGWRWKDSTTKTTSQPEWVGLKKRQLHTRIRVQSDGGCGFIHQSKGKDEKGPVGLDRRYGAGLEVVELLALGIFKPGLTLLTTRARANSCTNGRLTLRGLSDREVGRKVEQVKTHWLGAFCPDQGRQEG